jgi:site-specific DNA-methyltransferase (adenine-specific)
VLAYGTGALNIDASRIGFASKSDEQESKNKNRHADFGSGPRQNRIYSNMSQRTRADAGNYDPPGRWPANVVFSHTPQCVCRGEREAKSNGHWAQSKTTGYGKHLGATSGGTSEYNGIGYHPGTETVEEWECADGCPVALLDTQSQGASRFFKVVGADEDEPAELTPDAPFLYTAKPSSREKDAGLEDVEALPWVSYQTGNGASGKASSISEGRNTMRRNQHPTVKPIELMRWLVRMVTPTAAETDGLAGVVLDPFLGSGSTGCAAVLEGVRFIGIERDPEYLATAEKRILHWAQSDATLSK